MTGTYLAAFRHRLLNKPIVLAMSLALAGCAGSGGLVPPAPLGDEQPQSVMQNQPPVDYTQPDQQAPLQQATLQQPASQVGQPATSATANPYKAPASRSVLTFEPMVGAPKTVARELSKSLGQRVAQQALPVVARSDTSVTHRIKGYFSASQSGQDCVVSYVWDIFDAGGKRINRITGSQKTAMVSTDPWDAVTTPVLDKVAVDTAGQLKTWHASL